ncbi:hypothetical protein ACLBXX_13010 [Microbacterium sp. C23T]
MGAAVLAFGPATPAFAAERMCDAAVALAKGGGDDALRIAAELLENQGWSAAQIATCLAPAGAPDPEYYEVSLGALWTLFSKNLDLLVPIVTFVGVFALVLLALGRLLALVPGLRNPRSLRGWRIFAWIVGLSLAVIAPALVALRGMWVIAQDGPYKGQRVDGEDFGFAAFLQAVTWRSPFWWLMLALLLITVATLTFAFATRAGVTIKLESSSDGTGLDTAHVMAAMDGMAGSTNRGLEFPVGTDLTSAANAVSELSENKFVATLQVAVTAILGSTPWRVAVENMGDKSASVTISRNGALIKAKRIKLGEELADVTELTAAELLAARIAGELIASLRSRYRSEYDADLSGATDGESIALHYVASSALSTNRGTRAKGIPILARSVELDPQNRAAWTTLANFAYRDPTFHDPKNPRPHVTYRDFLDRAILEELRRGRNRWDGAAEWMRTNLSGGPHPRDEGKSDFVVAQYGVRKWRMRRNGLLVRLLQTRVVAAVNAEAAYKAAGTLRRRSLIHQQAVIDAEYMRLRRETFGGPLTKREPPKTAIRRRQLLLLDEFRVAARAPFSLDPPQVLTARRFRSELRAWEEASERASGFPTVAARNACERAALAASGDFDRDPIVAYSLACYRAVQFTSTQGSP